MVRSLADRTFQLRPERLDAGARGVRGAARVPGLPRVRGRGRVAERRHLRDSGPDCSRGRQVLYWSDAICGVDVLPCEVEVRYTFLMGKQVKDLQT